MNKELLKHTDLLAHLDIPALFNASSDNHTEPHDHEYGLERNISHLRRIQEAGGFQAYVHEQGTLRSGFSTPSEAPCLCCSDERILGASRKSPGAILFDLILCDVPEDTIVRNLQLAGVTRITSHAGCGAALLAYRKHIQLNLEPHATTNFSSLNSDTQQKCADWFAQAVISKFCINNNFEYGHIPEHEMVPEGHVHPGPVVYVNLTRDVFTWEGASLVQGFYVDANTCTDAPKATHALLNIAFSKGNAGHALKNRKIVARTGTEEKHMRMCVVVVAQNQTQANKEQGKIKRFIMNNGGNGFNVNDIEFQTIITSGN